jgi:hypothetical protein
MCTIPAIVYEITTYNMSKYLYSLIFGLLLFTASPVHAYFTTNQQSFSVDGKVGVYVIDFAFGHEKHEISMPVQALRGTTTGQKALGFEMLSGNNEIGTGDAVAIVLSDLKHKNAMYTVPKGKKATFRLLMLYTYGEHETLDTFNAQVTHLPFAFRGVQDLYLNESELRAYTTKTPQHSEPAIHVLRSN